MSTTVRLSSLLFVLVFAWAGSANEGTLAFVGATVIDGTAAAPLSDGVLVISDGRVRSVGPRSAVTLPDDAEIISVEGKTIMPGLINAHGHVGATVGLDANADSSTENLPGSCVCMLATASLQLTVSGEMRQPGLRCATSSIGPI